MRQRAMRRELCAHQALKTLHILYWFCNQMPLFTSGAETVTAISSLSLPIYTSTASPITYEPSSLACGSLSGVGRPKILGSAVVKVAPSCSSTQSSMP